MTTTSTIPAGTKPPEPSADSHPRPGQVEAVCSHPFEEVAQELATIYLNQAVGGSTGWAWHRLPVTMGFYTGADGLYKIRIGSTKVEQGNKVHASIELKINSGFLIQNPAIYLEYVVPECIAKTVDQISMASKGTRKVGADAGSSWTPWFKKITQRDPLTIESMRRIFSKVAGQIADGLSMGECKCDGHARFHGLDSQALLKVGQGSLRCETCKAEVVLVAEDRRPYDVAEELQFIAWRRADTQQRSLRLDT